MHVLSVVEKFVLVLVMFVAILAEKVV